MGPNTIIAPSLPFEFPPGHVLAIKTAVMEIQSKYGGSGLHHSKAKRRKVDKTASSKNIEEMAGARVNIPNIKEDICNKIQKWAKDHNNGEFNSRKQRLFHNYEYKPIRPNQVRLSASKMWVYSQIYTWQEDNR